MSQRQPVDPGPRCRGSVRLEHELLVCLFAGGLLGCRAPERELSLDLLPETTSNRIEAAVTLPREPRLVLQWRTPPSQIQKEARVEVWAHRQGSRGELLAQSEVTESTGSLTVNLGTLVGEEVFLRASARSSHVRWTSAELLGRSSVSDSTSWRIRATEGAPNVIVCLIDALRPDVLAPYGGPDPTPTLARLASEGTVFERAYSTASWTRPAVASLFSGLSVSAHRVPTQAYSLPDQVLTLAERLRLAGYQTMGVISNGHIGPTFNFDQGFEIYTAPPEPPPPENKWAAEANLAYNPAAEVHGMVLQHLAERRDPERPLFLYVHTVDPHSPYHPPRWLLPVARPAIHVNAYLLREINQAGPHSSRFLQDLALAYRGSVAYADEELGTFLSRADQFLDLDNSVLVVTSDHGEAFYEHGLVGHSHWIHEELIRIPLILRAPGVPAGTRNAELVSIVDVLPTVVRLVGGSPIDVAFTNGRDLREKVEGSPWGERAVVAEHAYGQAIVKGEWKLTHHNNYSPQSRYELFNLRLDSREGSNLVDQHPEVFRQLLGDFSKWRDDAAALAVDPLPIKEGEVPKAVIDNLRALGYIQ